MVRLRLTLPPVVFPESPLPGRTDHCGRALRARCALTVRRRAGQSSLGFGRVRVRVREPKISPMLLPAVFYRVRGSGFGTPLWVGRRKPTHRDHPRKSSIADSVRERRAALPATRKGATARAVTPHERETRIKVKD